MRAVILNGEHDSGDSECEICIEFDWAMKAETQRYAKFFAKDTKVDSEFVDYPSKTHSHRALDGQM